MQRLGRIIACCCFILLGSHGNVAAGWPWSSKDLATINGQSYTAADYTQWWSQWKSEASRIPQEPDDFIEWQLLVNEALAMELDQESSYKRRLEVYRKARSRMFLKYEAVDSKVDISGAAVQDLYEQEYSPLYLFDLIVFSSGEKAGKSYNAIQRGEIHFPELASSLKDDSDIRIQRGHYSPRMMKEYGFYNKVSNLEPGETSPLIEINNTFAILNLVEKVIPTAEEAGIKKQQIRTRLRKEQEAKYTAELISELREKYEVRVDEGLFAAITPDLSGEILNKPLIFTNRGNIPAKLLVKDLRDEYRYRKLNNIKGEEAELIKKGFLEGLISGTLVEWESLDRHYEDKEPFRDKYFFYGQLQLIKELENINIMPQVMVNDAEVQQYYEKNIDEFRKGVLLSLASITDEEKIIEKIWDEIKQGQDFFAVAKKYYTRIIPIEDIAENNLAPAVINALENLAEGDVSQPFLVNDHYTLIKLVGRKQSDPEPLDIVRGGIVQKLRQRKFQARKQEYIAKLYENAAIEINRREWEKVRKTLQDNDIR